jgi:hypothetical protein
VESWRKVWREGFAPLLSRKALVALSKALEYNDPSLIQRRTTDPVPGVGRFGIDSETSADSPLCGACAIGYCGWKGEGLETVGEVEEFFASICHEADKRLGEPGGCRWFLNWFDETDRRDTIPELAAEVALALMNKA